MLVNTEFVTKKREARKEKIKLLANAQKVDVTYAAMWVDGNSPLTTNKNMLKNAGYTVDSVTVDNCEEVIQALFEIGITIIDHTHLTKETLASTIQDIITEPVPECWGGADMREYVSLSSTKNV